MKLLFIRNKSLSVRIIKTLGISEDDYQRIGTEISLRSDVQDRKHSGFARGLDKRCQIESREFNPLQTRATHSMMTSTIVDKSLMDRKRY